LKYSFPLGLLKRAGNFDALAGDYKRFLENHLGACLLFPPCFGSFSFVRKGEVR